MIELWKKISGVVLQSVYWTAFCGLYSFAAVFLLRLSFSSSSIGLLMAGASLVAVFLQPMMGHFVDEGSRTKGSSRLKQVALGIVLVTWLSCFGLILLKDFMVPTLILYFIGLTGIIILQPLFSAIILKQEDGGQSVNFGVARAFGSFFYAIASVVVGLLIESYTPGILPLISILWLSILFVVVYCFPEGFRKEVEIVKPERSQFSGFGFIHQYAGFLKMMIGLALVFVFHTLAGVFLINIIKANGGTESQLGFALMLMAVVEIPVMIGSKQLMKWFGEKKLFIIAMVFYVIRSLALLFAQDMMGIYVAQLLQAFSFAIYVPLSVSFIKSWMLPRDQVKGQTMIVSANTLGSVLGSVLGGLVIDAFGIVAMLTMGSLCAAAGGGLVIWGIYDKEKADLKHT